MSDQIQTEARIGVFAQQLADTRHHGDPFGSLVEFYQRDCPTMCDCEETS